MPLNIDFQQILLHLFNFAILAGGLYFLLYKPIRAFMEERTRVIEDRVKAAAHQMDEANAVKASYEEKLAALDQEMEQRRREAEKDIESKRQAALNEAKKEADQVVIKARENAEKERSIILEDAQNEIRQMASKATEKLVRDSLKNVYDEFLDKAGSPRRQDG